MFGKKLEKIKKGVDICGNLWYSKQVGCDKEMNGILAQLGEHLPYKQGVTGSSPVGPISFNNLIKYGEVAQLARACGSYPQCRGFKSLPRY